MRWIDCQGAVECDSVHTGLHQVCRAAGTQRRTDSALAQTFATGWRTMDRTISTSTQSAPAPAASVSGPPAIPFSRYLLFGVPAIVGCAGDLGTKGLVFPVAEIGPGNLFWLGERHGRCQL